MTEHAINEILATTLDLRSERIRHATALVTRTKELFDQCGSPELKTTYGRFDDLIKGLKSSQVILAFIGEFSRGKSSLVNSLLGVQLLDEAQQQTTAINTFIHALPAGEDAPFLMIHFKEEFDRLPLRLPWDNDLVLKTWGTELVAEHRDARLEVDRIEAFTRHPLLDKGLILVDTPGLQGVLKHHQDITMEAIDQAHIAIWVQSAQQLGGADTEWRFLRSTLRKNFNKFITVINWWDLILDSKNPQDRDVPRKELEDRKLEVVRKNFRDLVQATPDEFAVLTSSQNLMGVSATWGRDPDPVKRSLSRIDELAERIAELCTGEEAQREILRKPLTALIEIHATLLATVQDEIRLLESPQDLKERKRELELLEQEIKNLNLELKNAENEARSEHYNAALHHAKRVQETLVEPLKELKNRVEQYLTPQYVSRQIEKATAKGGDLAVGLPEAVQEEFERVTKEVVSRWERQKSELEVALSDLRVNYQEEMARRLKVMHNSLDNMDIRLPGLDIELAIDLSSVVEYQKKAMELHAMKENCEKEIVDLDFDLAQHAEQRSRIELARQSLERAERNIQNLGPQPPPLQGTRREKVTDGGIWSSDKHVDVPCSDNSNVRAYQKEREELKEILRNREKAYERVIEEEFKRSEQRMSLKAAQQKVEAEIRRLEGLEKNLQQKAEADQAQIAEQIYTTLSRRTVGDLAQRIGYLEQHVSSAVQQVFNDQLDLLLRCVEEQFVEPLRARVSQREQAMESIGNGEKEVAQRLTVLQNACQQLNEVAVDTKSALAI